MQKEQITVIFVLFSSIVFGQTRFGTPLHDSTVHSLTSLSNALYAGVENKIYIQGFDTSEIDTVLVKCNNGHILFDDNYLVVPRRPGNLRIEIHTVTDSEIDTFGYYNFEVLPLPTPTITFGNYIMENNMSMSRNAFINSDSMRIIITEDIPESINWIKIKEFTVGYNYGGFYIESSSRSSAITPEMKKLVYEHGKGRWFSIKLITQSSTSFLHTNPMYKIFIY